jgi:hypothetical protein
MRPNPRQVRRRQTGVESGRSPLARHAEGAGASTRYNSATALKIAAPLVYTGIFNGGALSVYVPFDCCGKRLLVPI